MYVVDELKPASELKVTQVPLEVSILIIALSVWILTRTCIQYGFDIQNTLCFDAA